MAQQQSLADKLVFFMRMRDEAKAKIDAIPQDEEAWSTLSVMLDQQERAAADALYEATMTADRLGRLAEQTLGRLAELTRTKKKA